MKYFITGAIFLLIIGGLWWVMQTPNTSVPESEEVPVVENDVSTGETQPADSMQNAETVSFSNDETSISVTFTPEQALLTGLGYADVSLTAVPAASGARYESNDPPLTVWNKGTEVTVYQDETEIFVGTTEPVSEDSGATQSANTLNLLTAKTWVWQETQMNNGDITIPADTDAFTVTFTANGQVSGTTDCNSLSGEYELNDTSISMGPFAMTKMYCEDSQEQEFVDDLTEADMVFFDEDDNLVLLLPYDSGSVIFAPETN